MSVVEKVSVIIPVTRPKLAQKAKKTVLKQKEKDVSLEVILLPAKGKTPGQARNLGAKKAKGKILLFLDDDCQAGKNWLKENLKALRKPKVGAVGGMILGKSKKYFARCLDFANFTFVQNKKRREMPLCAASLGIKKKIFEKVKGFNEKMEIGEDVDLSMRLQRLGYQTVYKPEVKVFHHHQRESFWDVWRYQYNNGRVKGLRIEMRYPNTPWFAFLNLIARPWTYWFFIVPFAILATLVAVTVNLKDRPEVFWLAPGIFLAKLACQLGIFVWLLEK